MPYVIVGHNQRVAWGFTNVGPTVADAYIENFNAQGAYQTPQGWQQPEHREEVILVKGKADVTVEVRITRHGPIISELIPGETRQVALRWTLYDGLHMPFFDVDTAQNWEDLRKAFSLLDAPGQNVVYADVDGNIGYQATGHIPIRTSGDGSLPVSGADDAHEWTGYIPFDKLPSIYNPSLGHHRYGERAHHARWISLFDQCGVGGALANCADLSCAGVGPKVRCVRYARAGK